MEDNYIVIITLAVIDPRDFLRTGGACMERHCNALGIETFAHFLQDLRQLQGESTPFRKTDDQVSEKFCDFVGIEVKLCSHGNDIDSRMVISLVFNHADQAIQDKRAANACTLDFKGTTIFLSCKKQ